MSEDAGYTQQLRNNNVVIRTMFVSSVVQFFFNAEKNTRELYTDCCHNRKEILELLQPYPDKTRQLIDGSDKLTAHFKEHTRLYNSELSSASMCTHVTPVPDTGPHC